MTDKTEPLNTNDLRSLALRSDQLRIGLSLHRAADELDATRTERNIERAAWIKAEAELETLKGSHTLVAQELAAVNLELKELREAADAKTRGSLAWWVIQATEHAEDHDEEGYLVDRDHWQQITRLARAVGVEM